MLTYALHQEPWEWVRQQNAHLVKTDPAAVVQFNAIAPTLAQIGYSCHRCLAAAVTTSEASKLEVSIAAAGILDKTDTKCAYKR